MKTKTLSDAALRVLSTLRIEGQTATITQGQLSRDLYVEANKALEALGGKWSKKLRAHVFDGKTADTLTDAIDQVLTCGGFTDKKQELGQFFTPAPVADLLVKLADIKAGMTVLEPSAGHGALLRALHRLEGEPIFSSKFETHAVEIDDENTKAMARSANAFPCVSILTADFLKLHTEVATVDRIVMNPPFARGAAIAHVLHAWKFLKPGGLLAAILPSGVVFRQDKAHAEFRRFCAGYCLVPKNVALPMVGVDGATFLSLPDDSFAESGTNVSTVIVVLKKTARS